MSALDLTAAIDAAHRAVCSVPGCLATSEARMAVEAAAPLIAAQVRDEMVSADAVRLATAASDMAATSVLNADDSATLLRTAQRALTSWSDAEAGPAEGPEDPCATCGKPRREHRPGYSAHRCTFVVRPALSAPTIAAALREHWAVFRTHRPVGAYFPLGQLDGDCATCGVEWPCDPVLAAMGGVS